MRLPKFDAQPANVEQLRERRKLRNFGTSELRNFNTVRRSVEAQFHQTHGIPGGKRVWQDELWLARQADVFPDSATPQIGSLSAARFFFVIPVAGLMTIRLAPPWLKSHGKSSAASQGSAPRRASCCRSPHRFGRAGATSVRPRDIVRPRRRSGKAPGAAPRRSLETGSRPNLRVTRATPLVT